jgi:ring-1,2-phenylacetyl-CoA epoxidase subunit PaaE
MTVRMALHFHNLTIESIKKETPDCVSIGLRLPEDIKSEFVYEAGQYLTFKAIINGEEVRRSYSLCSSPLDNEWKVAVKKVDGGKFSSFANDVLKEGQSIDAMKPMGNFTCEFKSDHAKNYVAFAAGSGITPVIALIKTCLLTEPESQFTLFYGNKTSANIIFKEELEALKNQFLARFRIFYVFSKELEISPLFSGRIDGSKLDSYCQYLINTEETDEYFLCGPEEMIFAVKDSLEAKGISEDKIHFELFTTPETKINGTKETDSVEELVPGQSAEVTVQLDGNTMAFTLEYDGESILDKALSLGADLPFACKGGVCSTCRAKLTEGQIKMDNNYSLEPDELERGFILTCQSHPRSEKIFVDYDHS